jgi:hypothetical protein
MDECVMDGILDEVPGCEQHGDLQRDVRGALEGRAGLLLSLGAEDDRRLAAAAVEHLGTAAAATGGGVAETWSWNKLRRAAGAGQAWA